jgi:pimeloyl-ACP methyl ester carboxylesterase
MEAYEGYNDVLRNYSEWVLSLEYKVDVVVDINTALGNYIKNMHEKDNNYKSGDGIHPGSIEHWIITKSIIKKVFNITLEIVGNAESKDKAIKSDYKGYLRYDFYLNGREGVLICPKKPVKETKWVWRTEFLGAFDQADMSLVEKGWYLAYYRLSDMYGSPEAVELMRNFQGYMEVNYGLNEKAVLFGFSRGGLYAVNYTAKYAEKVAVLYLDAPVLDIHSWPGGFGMAERYHKEWNECIEAYQLTEETASAFTEVPLNKVHSLASAHIPIIIVAGGADMVVPFEENSMIMVQRLEKAGAVVKLILKPDIGHHPHSLEDATPVVEFIVNNFA